MCDLRAWVACRAQPLTDPPSFITYAGDLLCEARPLCEASGVLSSELSSKLTVELFAVLTELLERAEHERTSVPRLQKGSRGRYGRLRVRVITV